MKTLYIVRGCPGNGKTTLANQISPKFPSESIVTIAADEMPGLYVNGVYQQHLQKQSHEWCLKFVENCMADEEGKLDIVVHNTFTRIFYIKPYIELANKYGYSAHIIHSEAVLTAGGRTTDTHNVPADVLVSMRNGWENWDALPKMGMTPRDIAEQIEKAKAYPDAIIFDMDGTIKRTKSGETFPRSVDDFEITEEFKDFLELIEYDFENMPCDKYIVSNQRGLSGGQKTEEFLKEEWKYLGNYLHEAYNFFPFRVYFFAKDKAITWRGARDYPLEWDDNYTNINGNFAKPSPAIFDLIHKDSNRENYWIIGNAHTDDRSEDWQFAQNCQKAHPELNICYIPIELAAYVYKLHHA